MGLPVQSKKYEFGLTYELLSTREESKPDESDKTGGSWINSKLRVLVVASDVLKKAREIEPDSVVAPGLSDSHRRFIKRRWSNIRTLAELCEDAGRVGWIV